MMEKYLPTFMRVYNDITPEKVRIFSQLMFNVAALVAIYFLTVQQERQEARVASLNQKVNMYTEELRIQRQQILGLIILLEAVDQRVQGKRP